jgi:Zn-dependent protease
LDLSVFLNRLSYWTIPVLFAITLHEVAHGWMARCFGDRTAEMLGRLSLNPLRHIDPVGTVLVPGILLATSGLLFGWAKPVPVATKALRNPRLAGTLVALAGPAANFAMAGLWCGVLAGIVRVHGNETLIGWIASMA